MQDTALLNDTVPQEKAFHRYPRDELELRGESEDMEVLDLVVIPYADQKDHLAGGVCPDLLMFEKSRSPELKKAKYDIEGCTAHQELHFECKGTYSQDPFTSVEQGLEHISSQHRQTLGQLCVYSAIAMQLSFRKHFFTVFVAGPYLRFIRWDRSGAVVTRAIEFSRETKVVFQFFALFSQLSSEERGYEPGITRVKHLPTDKRIEVLDQADKGIEKMRSSVMTHIYDHLGHNTHRLGKAPKTALKGEDLFVTTINIPGRGECRVFILPPTFELRCISPFSRATRTYLVYDPVADAVYFGKDSWREISLRTLSESEVYDKLEEAGVPYVANKVAGGDIPAMTTRWQEECFDGPFYKSIGEDTPARKPLQLHRIFLSTIGRNLRYFKTRSNLFKCVGQAAEGKALIQDIQMCGALIRV